MWSITSGKWCPSSWMQFSNFRKKSIHESSFRDPLQSHIISDCVLLFVQCEGLWEYLRDFWYQHKKQSGAQILGTMGCPRNVKLPLLGTCASYANMLCFVKRPLLHNYWNHITFQWRWFIAFRPCRLITTHWVPCAIYILYFLIWNTIWILKILKKSLKVKNPSIFKNDFTVKVELGLLNRKMSPNFNVTPCNITDPSTLTKSFSRFFNY